MTTKFQVWYQKNKERLAEKRKAQYRSDPFYRQQAIERAADYRQRTRSSKPSLPGMTVGQVCDDLGITPWTLNSWRANNYFPEPERVGGRPVFEYKQLELLRLVRQFFDQYPKRKAALHRDELMKIVDVVHHNWK